MIILKSKNLIVVYNPLMDGNLADYISWKGWKIFNGEQEITTIKVFCAGTPAFNVNQ